jgi:hypothetical protein
MKHFLKYLNNIILVQKIKKCDHSINICLKRNTCKIKKYVIGKNIYNSNYYYSIYCCDMFNFTIPSKIEIINYLLNKGEVNES